MSKVAKTLDRVLRGDADAGIRFQDLRTALASLGFAERIKGDHYIFTRDGVSEILNLQPRGSMAKAYQVKQVRGVLTSYRLAGTVAPKSKRDTDEEADDKTRPKATEEGDVG